MSLADSREGESRRAFLQQLGVGTLGLLAPTSLLVPRTALAVCEPPGSPGTPSPWRHDCRPIRPRRPASTLSGPEIQKLKDAYKAMRDLTANDPDDPRGFMQQANVHCWNCGAGPQVHGSWQFFAWHRAYLYFHERILGKLVNDMDLRLPYWDWDEPGHRKIPGAYDTPNDGTNPLWNGTRGMAPGDDLPDEDVGTTVMQAALTAANFTDFGGTASFGGIPEGSPHGSVHVDVGGDMGAFSTAARDPIFYAHHSNVDKMWSDWNKGSSTHTNPTDPAFLNLTWSFFDENKVWRSIKASQVLDHESQLRYVYGPSKFWEILPCILDWVVVKVPWKFGRATVVDPRVRERLRQVLERKLPLRLHIDAPQVSLNRTAIYRVYGDPEEAKADKGPESPGYLGVIPIVLNDRENHHQLRRPPRVVFDVTRRGGWLLAPDRPLQLTFIERGNKKVAGEPRPLNGKQVFFSYGELAE